MLIQSGYAVTGTVFVEHRINDFSNFTNPRLPLVLGEDGCDARAGRGAGMVGVAYIG